MPKKGNGQSLKTFTVSGWYGSENQPGQRVEAFTVQASNLVGAVGRGARVARKGIIGKFTMATINVEAQ